MVAIQNYWKTSFERGCGETLDTPGSSNQTLRSIKGKYGDMRFIFFTCFPAANCIHSAGNDSNCKSCKILVRWSHLRPKTCDALTGLLAAIRIS